MPGEFEYTHRARARGSNYCTATAGTSDVCWVAMKKQRKREGDPSSDVFKGWDPMGGEGKKDHFPQSFVAR